MLGSRRSSERQSKRGRQGGRDGGEVGSLMLQRLSTGAALTRVEWSKMRAEAREQLKERLRNRS